MTLEQVTPSGVERSAANFSDIDFSSPCSDVSLSSQRTALNEMRSSSAASGAFLPDVEIIGADTALAVSAEQPRAAQAVDSRDTGALSTARDYWNSYEDEAVNEGGLTGFAKYFWGRTMNAVVDGVQAAKDARDYWSDAERNADSAGEAVLAGVMHDILLPAAVLDHVGAASNEVGSVNFNQVENGLRNGVLRGEYGSPDDVMKSVLWLDQQIPRDGTAKTEDRRTALLVSLAQTEAQRLTLDPLQQEEIAYDRLFALRVGLSMHRESLPKHMQGRELDPDISAAEHFFEVSKRVAADTMEIGPYEVSANRYATAPAWATIGAGYAWAKRVGILGGSEAGEHQTSWELAGIMRGWEINSRRP
ncbi:MAG: hypothetical protein K2Y39_09675 [Candidatus Obscuribacterales bacterium]|nr:hypothetical protein [Candidatus Obscuribacterales bacterium]